MGIGRRISWGSLAIAALAACSTILGADFDSATTSPEDAAGHDAPPEASQVAPGQALWVAGLKGEITQAGAAGLLVDTDGAIYVSGVVVPPVDFGCPGGAWAGSSKNLHAFIAKYTAEGECSWARAFDSGYGNRVALGADGHPWLIGYFNSSLHVDEELGTLLTAGGNDNFAIQLDRTSGKPLWARRFGSAATDEARTVVVHGSGDLVLAGGVLQGATQLDAFVARYSAAGDEQWFKTWASTGEDVVFSMALSGADAIVVTGTIAGNTGGDVELGAEGSAMFAASFSPTGALAWAQKVDEPGDQNGYGLAVGAGKVHLVGSAASSGKSDILVAALNAGDGSPSGTPRLYGMPERNEVAYAVALDEKNGALYLAGYFDGHTKLQDTSLTNAGSLDALVARLDTAGGVVWARSVGSAGQDAANNVAVCPDGSVVVLGTFQGTTLELDDQSVHGGGAKSFFLAKLAP